MTPNQLVDRLEETLGAAAAPVPLRKAIEQILKSDFSLPDIQAAERSESLVAGVVRTIGYRASEHENTGTLPVLTLVGSSTDVVCGSCFVFSTDGPVISAVKKNREFAKDILESMRRLTFAEFEKFGAAVLRELGVQKAYITPHAGDQGIDFYGEFSIGQLAGAPAPFFKLAHDTTFYFAGQAKHYPTRSIGPDVVRELVGAISLARTKTFSKSTVDLFEDVELRPFSPLMALLFTTGELTSGARSLAESAGLIARTGPQLALYLADRGVGISNATGIVEFDPNLFQAWLNAP